ncbi:MAG: hypothetical protein NTY48_04950 [Candidatus Diapherotrites archaeon]|nr:hypothetical protein [Candidatus Diapherotrites archaeon]
MHGQIMSYHATPLDSLQERVITTWVQQNRKELKGVESRWRIIKDQAGRDPMKILHELFEIAKKPGHTLPAKFVEELKAFLES